MICYDLEFPEVARILRLKGAELLLVPLANMKPYEKHQFIYLQSRAMKNQIPIVPEQNMRLLSSVKVLP
jgi:predicted amidohydrolase